jgi:hypothetical protein
VLWRADQHEALDERDWDSHAADAQRAIEVIVGDAEAAVGSRRGSWPGHPLDDVEEDEQLSSLYLGSAGMTWASRSSAPRLMLRGRLRPRSSGIAPPRTSVQTPIRRAC